ncbi:MAG: HEAT repeat domain-containing protein [Planctomycetota bacterium]|jgi:HEAT repeat protein
MRLLMFLVGALIGAFGLLTAQNFGFFVPDRPPIDVTLIEPRELPRRGFDDAAFDVLVDEIRSELFQVLTGRERILLVAGRLDEAVFERDWDKVIALVEALRTDGPALFGERGAVTPSRPVVVRRPEKPILSSLRDVTRRLELRALNARRNEATALLSRTDAQAVAQLVDMTGRHPDPQVRRDAARIVAETGDENGLRALVDLLRSTDAEARAAAAQALGDTESLDGAVAMTALLQAGGEPEELQLNAVFGLSRFDELVLGEDHPATQALLLALKEHRLASIRRAAGEAFGVTDLDRADEVRDAMIGRLKDDDSPVVRMAVASTVLQYTAALSAPPDLIEAASGRLSVEPSPEVREQLLLILEHGDEETLATLEVFASTPAGREHAGTLARVRKHLKARLEGVR